MKLPSAPELWNDMDTELQIQYLRHKTSKGEGWDWKTHLEDENYADRLQAAVGEDLEECVATVGEIDEKRTEIKDGLKDRMTPELEKEIDAILLQTATKNRAETVTNLYDVFES